MAAATRTTRKFLFLLLSFFVVLRKNIVHSNEFNLGNLAEIFSTLAGGEGCVFRCPKGTYIFKNHLNKKQQFFKI